MGRLKTELKTAWPDASLPPSMDALDTCHYLTALIKESLRFTAPPCRLSRYNPNATEYFENYALPPGTTMSVSLPMLNMDPDIWGPDAEVFRPERWLGEENQEGKLNQYLLSFSRGTRVCPGVELVWVEMRLLFAYLVRRFDLGFDEQAGVGDDDVLVYYDGFMGICRNWCQRLVVWAKAVEE